MKFQKEFVFDEFDDAMKVHMDLFRICRENGYVTCADLRYLIKTSKNEDAVVYPISYYEYGWTNLMETKLEPCDGYINGKWVLKMPKVKLLK